jgi:hypothetical protein
MPFKHKISDVSNISGSVKAAKRGNNTQFIRMIKTPANYVSMTLFANFASHVRSIVLFLANNTCFRALPDRMVRALVRA